MRAAFRVDASRAIGTGHVGRCLTLAAALRDAGGDALFLCRAHDGHLNAKIEEAGFPVLSLPKRNDTDDDLAHSHWLGATQADDAKASIAALAGHRIDWLVVDHYGLDARWESALRRHAHRILAIDDLADRSHDCDLLLDQNFFLDAASRYDGLLPDHCRPLLGPRYAVLRPDFAKARQDLRARDGHVRRLLVFFGGVDAGGHTALALDALDRLKRDDLIVDVVIGALNPRKDELVARCGRRQGTRAHVQGVDMAGLMRDADLALGAGGVTNWERACLGLPSIVLGIADNQRPIVADLCAAGLVWGVADGAHVTAHDLAALISADGLRAMAQRAMALVDGQGVRRVLAAMRGADIAVRPVGAEEGERLYAWRNDPRTRRYARDPRPLALDAHLAWFRRALASDRHILLMGECAGAAIGVLRFDLDGDRARISIYLDPARHGEGLGAPLLAAGSAWLAAHRPRLRMIEAEVLAANSASHAIFLRAGFAECARHYRLDLSALRKQP